MHQDRVADLGPDHRAQDAEPVGLGLARGERVVGVLDVADLPLPRVVGPGGRDTARMPSTMEQVLPRWRVVPLGFLGGEVVLARPRLLGGNRNGEA